MRDMGFSLSVLFGGINDTSKLPPAEVASELVSVVEAHPGLREFQSVLVPPLGNQVEIVVGSIEDVDSPRVARIGVEDGAAFVLAEHAYALAVGHADVGFRMVEERRSAFDFLRGERGLVVVIEIVPARGDPLEAPVHPLLERVELGERGPGDGDEGHVAVIEVNAETVEIVCPKGAVL